MVEIETSKGFVRLLAYPETVYKYLEQETIRIVVDLFDEPQHLGFRAVEAANDGEAKFRLDGKEMVCAVELEEAPRLARERVMHRRAYLSERLRPGE